MESNKAEANFGGLRVPTQEINTLETSLKTADMVMAFIFMQMVKYLTDNGEPDIRMGLDKSFLLMEMRSKDPGPKENVKENLCLLFPTETDIRPISTQVTVQTTG